MSVPTRGSRVANAALSLLSPLMKGSNVQEPPSPWRNTAFSCLVCSADLGEGQRDTPFILCSGDAPRGHAAVCTKCFSRSHAKKAPFPLVQLVARSMCDPDDGTWVRASEIDFNDGLPARADQDGNPDPEGAILAYVTYDSSMNSGDMVCPECWEAGSRCLPIRGTKDKKVHSDDIIEDGGHLMDDVDAEPTRVQGLADISVMTSAQEIESIDRFLRLSALEETASDKIAAVATMLEDNVLAPSLSHLVKHHLEWNETESVPACTDFDSAWGSMLSAAQRRLQSLRANTIASSAPWQDSLRKFVSKSVILLESASPSTIAQVNRLASALPPTAQGCLLAASFSPDAQAFMETDHSVLATKLSDVMHLLPVSQRISSQAQSTQHVSLDGQLAPAPPEIAEAGTRVNVGPRPGVFKYPGSKDPRTDSTFDWNAASTAFAQLGLDPESATHYAQAAAATQTKRMQIMPLSSAPVLPPSSAVASTGTYAPEAVTEVEEGQQLMDLFKLHLHASDQERVTGLYAIPMNALTLYISSERLVSACKLRRTLDEANRDFLEFGLSDSKDPKFQVSKDVKYLNAFTQEDLTTWFKLAKSYLGKHAPQLIPLFRRVKQWVYRKDDTTEMGIYTFRAPEDSVTKERLLHMALGRLYMLSRSAQTNEHTTFKALEAKIQAYESKAIDMTPGQAARQLFANAGFVRAAPGTKKMASITPDSQAAKAEAHRLQLLWKGINGTHPCLNCGVSGHKAGDCPMARRPDLPCQLCFGLGGLHSESECPGPAGDTEKFATISQALWRLRTNTSAGAPPQPTGGGGTGN